MKPQDVVVAIKLVGYQNENWSYASLGEEVGIGHNQAHLACKRLTAASLMSQKHVLKRNLVEFLIHGVKYVFPPVWEDGPQHGIPTAVSGPDMKKELRTPQIVVWPTGRRKDPKGDALRPLHECVYTVIENDPLTYQVLSILESIRIGRAREREVAADLIRKKILEA